MLTILNDPYGVTGRQRHEFDLSLSLQDNIARHLSAGGDCELHINGVKVDPLTDARLDVPPREGDDVRVVRRPAGFDPVTWLAIASLFLSIYSLATAPRPDDSPVINDSPNNKLTGQTNIARAYQAVPDVYGHPRVWPDLIQPSVVEYTDHVKWITEWLCVSRGAGTISAVKYAETLFDDIEGATWQAFYPSTAGPISPGSPLNYPENQTTTLTNVVEAFATADVNGQELTAAADNDLVISRTGLLDSTIATSLFTLTFEDGAIFDDLKALAPSGTVAVTLNFPTFPEAEPCTVTGYSVSGGNVTFSFTASTHVWAASVSDEPVTCYIVVPAADVTETRGPFTLPRDAEQIWFNVVFLRGLKGTAEILAEWWEIDGAGAEIGGTRETEEFQFIDDTFDQRFFTRKITPAAGLGRYKIEFTRQNLATSDGADVAKLESLYAVRTYATKVLPGVTVVKVRTAATEAATGVRERKTNLRFNRHVRTLSTSAITEASITASRNFARVMAHIWCVAGGSIAELDTTTLAGINTALGETSPLLRFDGTFDDLNMSLGERLQAVANVARCKLWRDGTVWTVTRDQARGTTPKLQLDYRNLAAAGDRSTSYAGHLPASNDGVELEYVDEATLSAKAYVRLSIASGSVVAGASNNPLKIKLFGCCTEEQAENRAHLEVRRLLYQRESVSETALSDGLGLGLDELVRYVDPMDFAGDDGLQAGEVMSITGDIITTSEALDWQGETSGRMTFTGIDGLPLGAPVVVTPGSGGTVDLASVPAGLFLADGTTRQCGSRYAFAVGLTEAEMEAACLYVVDSVRPGASRTASLALKNYDERMYEED